MEREIQERIRECRKQRGVPLRRLTKSADCTPSYISQLEKGFGVPFLSMLGRLADALNITVRDMIERIVYRYARKGVLIRHQG